MTRSSDKLAFNRNNNSKLVSSRNNNNKLVSEKNNRDNKVEFSSDNIEYAKKSEKLKVNFLGKKA